MRKDNKSGMRKVDLLATMMLRRMPGRQAPTNKLKGVHSQGASGPSSAAGKAQAFRKVTGSKTTQAKPKATQAKQVTHKKYENVRAPKKLAVAGKTRNERVVVKQVQNKELEKLVAGLSKMFVRSQATLEKQFENRNKILQAVMQMMSQSDAQIQQAMEAHNNVLERLTALLEKQNSGRQPSQEDFAAQDDILQALVNNVAQRNPEASPDFMGMLRG